MKILCNRRIQKAKVNQKKNKTPERKITFVSRSSHQGRDESLAELSVDRGGEQMSRNVTAVLHVENGDFSVQGYLAKFCNLQKINL